MQRISLSEREELIESLDAEAIYDYLIQHGVLDQVEKEKIENGKNKAQRNTALLQLVEGTGSSAVALFINALRQSGQLSLASSLDENSRIKPIYGSGNCCHQFDFAFLFNYHEIIYYCGGSVFTDFVHVGTHHPEKWFSTQ